MKKRLSGFFKKTNEKRVWWFILAIMLGIVLMYISSRVSMPESGSGGEPMAMVEYSENNSLSEYEKVLEKRLEAVLSKAEGVGRVSALVTLTNKGEVELAEDAVFETTLTEDAGGVTGKKSLTEKRETKHIFAQGKDGFNEPVIIKQLEPKIEGVIIVADGGDNAAVKAQLTKAAGALLNLPAHKIEVLKMREE